MSRSLFAAALLLVASPLIAAPFVKRLGRCPHQFDFSAEITSRHPGEVTVQWLRSDGATGPSQKLHFNRGNETRRVFDHWRLGSRYRGWEQLRVTDGAGNRSMSRRVTFTNRCR
ncbi:MAG: hypothetical protein DMF58_07885 [Acidobacteria bacterium]|nr:MAG: hypothetical protein DMF58_07885 [Acidobacteriota bacterium]